jgi:ADP-ribosylglycohydrolase
VALNPSYLGDSHTLAREKWLALRLGEKLASNGSLMRTHPVGVMFGVGLEREHTYALAAHLSTATYADPRCTLAYCAAVGVLRGLIRGNIIGEDGLNAQYGFQHNQPY